MRKKVRTNKKKANKPQWKPWLRYHGIKLMRKITIANAGRTLTIEDEQVPSQEELARIFRASPPRVRVADAFMALAELRPDVLGNHRGTDGLRLGDLLEVRIEDGKAKFDKIPTIVVVRPSLSKARHKYFSFLGQEGCTYLAEYLEERLRSGENLTPGSTCHSPHNEEAACERLPQNCEGRGPQGGLAARGRIALQANSDRELDTCYLGKESDREDPETPALS